MKLTLIFKVRAQHWLHVISDVITRRADTRPKIIIPISMEKN